MWERVKKGLPVFILAGIGLGVSIGLEIVHRRLAADVNYTSFCNVSATVNCDVVMSSRYALLAGLPVSTWAILYYLAVLGLVAGITSVRRAPLRETLGTLTLAAALWGVVFSAYMAVVAFAVLHTVCVMCSALYLVNVSLFPASWRLRNGVRMMGRRQGAERARRDRWVLIGSVGAAVLLIAVGSWEALGRGEYLSDPAEIARQRPDFYRWYLAQPLLQMPADATHSRGSADAPVTIVEFSDFECGHCSAFHQSLEDVLRRVGPSVRVVFRHFPLDSACNPKVASRLHPQACLAAAASECAGEQGKFWQYHNVLFENQQRLDREFLIGYATRLGLDVARFTACLGSEAAKARVERDAQEGARLGVDSTPTFFINGRAIKGALDPERLSDALTLARANR
jgi:protein-disulfide isomerase/uncharacterized membrane protein